MTITTSTISASSNTSIRSTSTPNGSKNGSTRLALAPVRDACLNVKSPLSLKGKPMYLLSIDFASGGKSKIVKKKRLHDAFSLQKARRSWSYPEVNSGKSSLPEEKHSLSQMSIGSSNAAAGLAATKLKLKLQLAFYKLQQQQSRNDAKYILASVPSVSLTRKSPFNSSAKASSQHSQKDKEISNQLLTPPQNDSYAASVNVNLKIKGLSGDQNQKESLRDSRNVKLAYGKGFGSISQGRDNLKLFSIKKSSQYYKKKAHIPLVPSARGYSTNDIGCCERQQLNTPTETLPPTPPSLNSEANIRLPKPHVEHSSASIPTISHRKTIPLSSMSLPSIHKILKTPMKNSSTRTLVNSYLADPDKNGTSSNQNRSSSNNVLEDQNQTIVLNTDETIEEDEDSFKQTKGEKKAQEILSSSPLKSSCAFGTPNSFSVAKSLLQLGSGFYH